jgi:hypothetical protein
VKVLAIDPGERAGYATASVTFPADGGSLLEVQTHGIAFLKDMALALYHKRKDYDVIIYEDYRIAPAKLRAHQGSNVPTLQLVGMIRLCAWLNPQAKLVCQQPAVKATANKVIATNPVFTDIAQRINNAPAAHDDSHDTDALRHLAHWYWREYL